MKPALKFTIPDCVKYLAIAGVIVAIAVAVIFWANRGSQTRLEAKVLKTRIIETEDGSTLAVVELRIHNPANVAFVTREVQLQVTQANGATVDGAAVTQDDLDRLLAYYKLYGPRYNPVLRGKEKLAGGVTVDRTVAAAIPLAPKAVETRKAFVVTVDDVDGIVERLEETRTPGR